MIIIDQIKALLDGDKSVKMVADDIQLTSELILLVRMMFADGKLKPEELETFKHLCERAFGIPPEDVPKVIEYLNDVGYETTAGDAVRMFEDMDIERRRSLLIHMFSIARADQILEKSEVELIQRTANILGLSAEDIRAASGS